MTATYSVVASPLTRFRPGPSGTPGPLPADRPLETVAERGPLPFTFGAEPASFDLRLTIGRRWLKLVGRSSVQHERDVAAQYVTRYPVALPDPSTDVRQVAHPEVWAGIQTVAGRRMDGYLLYRHVKGGGHASDGITGLRRQDREALDALGPRLTGWFDQLIDQPDGAGAWDPRRLEHRFLGGGSRSRRRAGADGPRVPGR